MKAFTLCFWRKFVMTLLLFVVALQLGVYMKITPAFGFETTNLAKFKLRKNASFDYQQSVDTTREANRIFAESYDAEKIVNFYKAKYPRSDHYLLTIIVQDAVASAEESSVSPFILLAIISHESNFQPMVRNKSGATGLMQIIINVHKKRFEQYGGIQKVYLPEVNIRIGAAILSECIGIMKSVRGGLNCYAGTVNRDDKGFVNFVLKEAIMVKKIATRLIVPSQTRVRSVAR